MLFPDEVPVLEKPAVIKGLIYAPNFISLEEERALINFIDASPWLSDLKRRVQHYGYKYDYRARTINREMRLGDLPDILHTVGTRLYQKGYLDNVPDQAIINEYLPGQGITAHIDCEPCFTNYIVSISILAPIVMEFQPLGGGDKLERVLEPRSAVVLAGESRYKWYHGIPARKNDVINGIKTPRRRRISITFRKVILG